MPSTGIVGLQWGDEGKGKIIDSLAAQADVVARYAGGNNAGHTLIGVCPECTTMRYLFGRRRQEFRIINDRVAGARPPLFTF